ncbi:hypothetical protein DWB77_00250 [Streptomyces hundungensis]|uniref:Uncharacterized protein n=1 Tax=Streptomyces hundungensis TaxID=1077946 RepID=A0A387H7L7_9ACTN|nr:hypothetical protein DWB77_00250 [Streptomyces hundungensis]
MRAAPDPIARMAPRSQDSTASAAAPRALGVAVQVAECRSCDAAGLAHPSRTTAHDVRRCDVGIGLAVGVTSQSAHPCPVRVQTSRRSTTAAVLLCEEASDIGREARHTLAGVEPGRDACLPTTGRTSPWAKCPGQPDVSAGAEDRADRGIPVVGLPDPLPVPAAEVGSQSLHEGRQVGPQFQATTSSTRMVSLGADASIAYCTRSSSGRKESQSRTLTDRLFWQRTVTADAVPR